MTLDFFLGKNAAYKACRKLSTSSNELRLAPANIKASSRNNFNTLFVIYS